MRTRLRSLLIAATSIALFFGVTPAANATPPCYVEVRSVIIGFGTCTGAVVVEPGITKIGQSAFQHSDITSIDIPASVTTIDASAFEGVITLTSVTFREGLISIGDSSFALTGIRSIVIPNSVTYLGEAAFFGNLQVTSVIIGTGLTEIGRFAFSESSIPSIDIPASVRIIGPHAFYLAESLTAVTFHEGLIRIEECAFCETSMSSIVIPNSVTYVGPSAFFNNRRATNLVIGTGISAIAQDTFAGMQVTTINIPANVKVIGARAFLIADGVVTINLSEGLEVIEEDAFTATFSLVNLIIPNTVYSISTNSTYDPWLLHVYDPEVLARVAATAHARQIRIDAENRAAVNFDRMRAAFQKRVDARGRILAALKAGKVPVTNDLLEADFNGITDKNVSPLQSEIVLSSPKTIAALEYLSLKVVLVEKLSGSSSSILAISKRDLFAIGILGMNGAYKSEILRSISNADSSDRDTYNEVQVLAKKYLDQAEARHDRLIAVIERIYARK